MRKYLLLFLFIPALAFAQFKPTDSEIGIYFEDTGEQIYASVLGGHTFAKTPLAIFTFGLIAQERIPFLLSAEASQKTENPVFIFQMDRHLVDDTTVQFPGRSFRGATSPKEFLLLELNAKSNKNRRHILKEKNAWGTRIVANSIPFTFEQVQENVFVVTPLQKLEKGEYCFVHQDILNTEFFSDFMFFDFSVR